jgi:hypothetical protein
MRQRSPEATCGRKRTGNAQAELPKRTRVLSRVCAILAFFSARAVVPKNGAVRIFEDARTAARFFCVRRWRPCEGIGAHRHAHACVQERGSAECSACGNVSPRCASQDGCGAFLLLGLVGIRVTPGTLAGLANHVVGGEWAGFRPVCRRHGGFFARRWGSCTCVLDGGLCACAPASECTVYEPVQAWSDFSGNARLDPSRGDR